MRRIARRLDSFSEHIMVLHTSERLRFSTGGRRSSQRLQGWRGRDRARVRWRPLVVADTRQERLLERTAEATRPVLVARIKDRIVEQMVNGPVPWIMEKAAEVQGRFLENSVSRFGKEIVGVVHMFTQDRVMERIMKEIIEAVRSTPQKCVQCTVEQVVDVPVRQRSRLYGELVRPHQDCVISTRLRQQQHWFVVLFGLCRVPTPFGHVKESASQLGASASALAKAHVGP